MIPQVLSLIQRTFPGAGPRPGDERLLGGAGRCGIVVGQVAGGLLISANLLGTSWRPVFLVNVPIGIALMLAGCAAAARRAAARPAAGSTCPACSC